MLTKTISLAKLSFIFCLFPFISYSQNNSGFSTVLNGTDKSEFHAFQPPAVDQSLQGYIVPNLNDASPLIKLADNWGTNTNNNSGFSVITASDNGKGTWNNAIY